MKFVLLASLLLTSSAFSVTHEILMVNKSKTGEVMVFEPNFLKIKIGDSVKFVPKDKGHSAQQLVGAVPAGVPEWKAGLNKEITVKYDKEGVHFFKCLPHLAMGMVGAVQVGKPTNMAQVKAFKMTGKAATTYQKVLAKIK